MGIAKNIKTLREINDLTQSELGKIAGASDKAVSTWESGAKVPRMGSIQKIADYFGISKSNIIEENGLDILMTKKEKIETSEEFILTEDEKDIIRLYRTLHPEAKKFIFKSMTAQTAPIVQSKEALEWSKKEEEKADEIIRKYEQQVLRAQSELVK